MSKLKRTFFLGSLLGAGLIWLTSTKKGKEAREQIVLQAQNIYEKLERRLYESGVVDKISQSTFVKRAKELVEEYSKQKNIPAAVKGLILQLVTAQWESFQERMKKPVKKVKTHRK